MFSLISIHHSCLQLKFHPEAGRFTIDDSYQEPVTLVSQDRDILAATFYKFVLKNIGEGIAVHGPNVCSSSLE